jgi:hypothetical protein
MTPLQMRDIFRARLAKTANDYKKRLDTLLDGYTSADAPHTAPALLVERSVVIQILARQGTALPLELPGRAQPGEVGLDAFARSVRDKERSIVVWQLRDYMRWLGAALDGTSPHGLLDHASSTALVAERAQVAQAISFFTTEPSVAVHQKPPEPPSL